MRTYKEAVDINVSWWIEKSFSNTINQDNKDESPSGAITFMLMNIVSLDAQKQATKEKIEKFRSKLTELLLKEEHNPPYYRGLEVDYGADRKLMEACKFAELSPSCLPCKTFTGITKENEIKGRYQLGEWFCL